MASETVAPEIFDSWSILIMLVLTSSTVAFAYIFQRTHFKFAHETFVAIVIGEPCARASCSACSVDVG